MKELSPEEISRYASEDRSRREFLRLVGLGLVSAPVFGFGSEEPIDPEPEETPATGSGPSSSVTRIYHAEAIEKGRPLIRKMIEASLLTLTGKETAREAWREFIHPEDVVGLKVNGLGGRGMSTNIEVIDGVIAGLLDAGVEARNIIVWDNTTSHVENCGYGNTEFPETRGLNGNAVGHSEPMEFESGSTRLTKIVTEMCSAIINLPVLKDHGLSGVTLALKNLSHGTVNNPGSFHENNCDPYIADICALPPIRNKLRLNILDGMRGVWDGGPGLRPEKSWYPQTLWASPDPVALDTIGTEVIEAKREEMGEPSLRRARRPPKHIQSAAERGLGIADRNRIELREVAL